MDADNRFCSPTAVAQWGEATRALPTVVDDFQAARDRAMNDRFHGIFGERPMRAVLEPRQVHVHYLYDGGVQPRTLYDDDEKAAPPPRDVGRRRGLTTACISQGEFQERLLWQDVEAAMHFGETARNNHGQMSSSSSSNARLFASPPSTAVAAAALPPGYRHSAFLPGDVMNIHVTRANLYDPL